MKKKVIVMDGWGDSPFTTNDYRNSVADWENPDMFSLGYQWADKPHRHVYQLCTALEEKEEEVAALRARIAEVERELYLVLRNTEGYIHNVICSKGHGLRSECSVCSKLEHPYDALVRERDNAIARELELRELSEELRAENEKLREALHGLYEHTKNNLLVMGLNEKAKQALNNEDKDK